MTGYITLINNFWLLSEEHDFRPIDIALYFYLLKIANSLSWKPSFRRNNMEIMAKLGISSRNTLYDTRNRLKMAGLIDYQSYNGKPFSTYSIIDTCSKNEQVTEQVTEQLNKNKTKSNIKKKNIKKKNHPTETELPLNVETPKRRREEPSPPTLEEVVKICVDKGLSEEEAKKFYYYYDAQGWVTTGGQKIRRIDSMVNRWQINRKSNEDGRVNNTNSSKKAARNREVIEDIMSRYK